MTFLIISDIADAHFLLCKNCEFGRLPEFFINEAFLFMDVLKNLRNKLWNLLITKTYLYNFLPPNTPLLYSKTGVYRDIHYFSFFFSKT